MGDGRQRQLAARFLCGATHAHYASTPLSLDGMDAGGDLVMKYRTPGRLDAQQQIRAYLQLYGLATRRVTRLLRHPAGTVYRATLPKPERLRDSPGGPKRGKRCDAIYVILGAGPPAHFAVNWHEQAGDAARAILRWYWGNLKLIGAEVAEAFATRPATPACTASAPQGGRTRSRPSVPAAGDNSRAR